MCADINIQSTLNAQQAAIVRGYSGVPNAFSVLNKVFAWPSRSAVTSESAKASIEFIEHMTPLGSSQFIVRNEAMAVGDSGITVRVTDLYMTEKSRTVFVGNRKYISPALTRMGMAEVTGTSGDDNVVVRQNDKGDTVLEVDDGGQIRTVNLGKIAALTLYGGAGDDKITVNVNGYYGGVTVVSGDGDDKVSVEADYSLAKGVVIEGGNGDDTLTVSGRALAVLIKGGAGSDWIDARNVFGEAGLSRSYFGDDDNDVVYGSPGKDVIDGGTGHDYISGGADDDVIRGGSGQDVVNAGSGRDRIYGGEGNDVLYGEIGDDLMFGEAGDDVLMGGKGVDYLSGGAGDDFLYGGSSDDEIVPAGDVGGFTQTGGANVLVGGDGVDTFAPSSTSPTDIVGYSGSGSYLLDYDADLDILI